LYPALAQKVTNLEVLRILLSIGGSEIMHFQTWHDKAGNAALIPTATLRFQTSTPASTPNMGLADKNIPDMFPDEPDHARNAPLP